MSDVMSAATATPALRGALAHDVDMSRHVSWRAGGRAEWFFTPADLDDLCLFLGTCPMDMPLHFVGLGSNLLIRDGGVRGTIIHLHTALRALRCEDRRHEARAGDATPSFGVVYSEAGVASPKLARFAANHDLVGAEFLAGIPGTVGGALAMNAGCYGSETWSYVSRVLTIDRKGALHKRSPKDFGVGYRHVEAKQAREEWFVAAWFLLPRGDGMASRRKITELLEKRVASQPLNLPNAGSVFRNPPGDHAARLIESCGLKGVYAGKAQVSEKHANFIVNRGGATATDIEDLISLVQERVAARTGIQLQREVRILGVRPEVTT
ncbi:MAG: UDP-N-acetylmuramate dehydrogenase [Hydrogenophilales bacterium]|nr:UDP-N-acetylmuramate dehydrogenase [Hydrogenophilales bacterium]